MDKTTRKTKRHGNAAEKAFVLFAAKHFKLFRNGWPDYFAQDLKTKTFFGIEVKQGANAISSAQQIMFAALDNAGLKTVIWNPNRPQNLTPWGSYKKDPRTDECFVTGLAAALFITRLEAVVVGSLASILNGALAGEHGVSLLVRDTTLNRKKLKRLAKELGGVGPQRLSELTSTEHIYGADLPIDIIYEEIAGGLSFASVKSHANPHVVGNKGELLMVASLADIIRSKTADRPKDRAVLPILHATLAARRAAGQKPEEIK